MADKTSVRHKRVVITLKMSDQKKKRERNPFLLKTTLNAKTHPEPTDAWKENFHWLETKLGTMLYMRLARLTNVMLHFHQCCPWNIRYSGSYYNKAKAHKELFKVKSKIISIFSSGGFGKWEKMEERE